MKNKKGKILSRRGILPLLGGSLIIPFLGIGKTAKNVVEEDEYETLIKPDGTAVKVKSSTVKQSKVIKSSLSNSELKSWLDNKK